MAFKFLIRPERRSTFPTLVYSYYFQISCSYLLLCGFSLDSSPLSSFLVLTYSKTTCSDSNPNWRSVTPSFIVHKSDPQSEPSITLSTVKIFQSRIQDQLSPPYMKWDQRCDHRSRFADRTCLVSYRNISGQTGSVVFGEQSEFGLM